METLEQSYQNDKDDMVKVLEYELANKRSVKTSIIFHAEFLKKSPTEKDPDAVHAYVVCLRSKRVELTNNDGISPLLFAARASAQDRIDDFIDRGKLNFSP